MKLSLKSIIVFGFVAALTARTFCAQTSDGFNFDENGYGSIISDHQGVGPLWSEVAADPSDGITNSSVLIYDLGYPVVAGDVALIEPGQTAIAKLIRFFPLPEYGDTLLIYYSQADGTKAGVGIPTSTNAVQLTLTNSLTIWYPTSTNQPGYSELGAVPMWFTGLEYYIHTASHTEPAYPAGTNLIWHYTGPFSSYHFFVLASTNMSLPQTNWTRVSTNVFDVTGSCTLTLPVGSGQPNFFYRIALPTGPF
jgi:hypothetical protein